MILAFEGAGVPKKVIFRSCGKRDASDFSNSEDQLAFLLSGVKLLMTNFPFFYSCFLTNLVETQCGQSFQEARWIIGFFFFSLQFMVWFRFLFLCLKPGGLSRPMKLLVKGSLVCKTSVLRTFNSCSIQHSSYTTHHTPLIIHHLSYTTHHTPLIIHHSSYTTHHTPLIIHHSSYTTHHTPLIIHRSSYTTRHTPLIIHHHTPLIIHHSSYTTHHTPLIIHHLSYTTHHTPLIIHHSSHTTHHTPLVR